MEQPIIFWNPETVIVHQLDIQNLLCVHELKWICKFIQIIAFPATFPGTSSVWDCQKMWFAVFCFFCFFTFQYLLKGLWRWHLRKPHLPTWWICATRSQVVPPPKLWITTPVTYSMLSVEDNADKTKWLWHFFHGDSTKSLPFSLQVLIK